VRLAALGALGALVTLGALVALGTLGALPLGVLSSLGALPLGVLAPFAFRVRRFCWFASTFNREITNLSRMRI
jgi:hypothetical protein